MIHLRLWRMLNILILLASFLLPWDTPCWALPRPVFECVDTPGWLMLWLAVFLAPTLLVDIILLRNLNDFVAFIYSWGLISIYLYLLLSLLSMVTGVQRWSQRWWKGFVTVGFAGVALSLVSLSFSGSDHSVADVWWGYWCAGTGIASAMLLEWSARSVGAQL
jgi:hypothetical protein